MYVNTYMYTYIHIYSQIYIFMYHRPRGRILAGNTLRVTTYCLLIKCLLTQPVTSYVSIPLRVSHCFVSPHLSPLHLLLMLGLCAKEQTQKVVQIFLQHATHHSIHACDMRTHTDTFVLTRTHMHAYKHTHTCVHAYILAGSPFTWLASFQD